MKKSSSRGQPAGRVTVSGLRNDLAPQRLVQTGEDMEAVVADALVGACFV